MLDIKRIREDFEGVKARVEFRGKGDFGIGTVKELDEKETIRLMREYETIAKELTKRQEVPRAKKNEKISCVCILCYFMCVFYD